MAALISGQESQALPHDKQTDRTEPLSADGVNVPELAGITRPPRDHEFPIVAIGASAGGLVAASSLIDAMPDLPGVAIILVQHLDPTHKSLMTDLLAQHTTMLVSEAIDQAPVMINHIYVIAPGTYLAVANGILHVSVPTARHGARLPFDFLLASLAGVKRRPMAAVVLSGTGADGSASLKAFKDRGGLVIAQNLDEAEYSGMPQSAIDTGTVDAVLPVARIASTLAAFAKNPDRHPASDGLKTIIELLRMHSPHDFRLYKPERYSAGSSGGWGLPRSPSMTRLPTWTCCLLTRASATCSQRIC